MVEARWLTTTKGIWRNTRIAAYSKSRAEMIAVGRNANDSRILSKSTPPSFEENIMPRDPKRE